MAETDKVQSPGSGVAERRSNPRYAVLIKGVADHVGLVGGGGFDVLASDVSEGGILLHANHAGAIAVEDLLKLTFSPLQDGDFVNLQVRVVWIKENMAPHLGKLSFGCFFFRSPLAAINEIVIPARVANELKLIPEPY
jgi:hypothetical protein